MMMNVPFSFDSLGLQAASFGDSSRMMDEMAAHCSP